jgi:glycosyltransferase involved in cell wall biosynthesis
MEIALVSRRFDGNSGSAEWIYADWLKKKLAEKGMKVYAIEQKSTSINSSPLAKAGYDFFILPWKLLYHRIFNNVKVFHFLGENQAVHSGFLRLMGARVITECYDIIRIKNKKFSADKAYFYLVYKLLGLANKIVAISSSTKEDLTNIVGLNKNRIEVIYPIYRKFEPKEKTNKKTIIGYLGALGGRKRTRLFAEIAENIIKKRVHAKIKIYGGGKDEELEKAAKNFKEVIKIEGFAQESELETIYNSFDFFVFPSQYEGLGLPIIEALMCGKPCFILDDGYFPEEVKAGCIKCKNAGEIIDKIIKIQKKGYNKKSKKAIVYSKKFNLEDNLDKLIKLYEEQ